MNEAILTTIALTGFTVAFFHAALPTHWLPFVAAGRAQRWTRAKTLAVTAFAGTGHVFATALLGLLLTAFGVVLSAKIGVWLPRMAGLLLICLGTFYLTRQLSGHGHSHTHLHGHNAAQHHKQHSHLHAPHIPRSHSSDRFVILSLFALLTFSPCEGFLPIYVSGIRFGWSGFALLTLILSIGTVAGMLVFTALTLAGFRNIRTAWLERWESGVIGLLLMLIGVLVLLFET